MPCDTGQEQTDQNQSAKRVNGGIRTPTDTTPGSFLSLLAVQPKQYNASKVNQSKEASNLSYLVAILRNHLSFWKEVEDCYHNSVMFADRVQKHFERPCPIWTNCCQLFGLSGVISFADPLWRKSFGISRLKSKMGPTLSVRPKSLKTVVVQRLQASIFFINTGQ